MSLNRRNFLKLTGGAALLGAAGTVGSAPQ